MHWHLAPLSMAWQDRNDEVLSRVAVCRAVTDRPKDYNLDAEHLVDTPLVCI